MRIAYFGYDFFAACLTGLVQAGHEIINLHTFHTDNTWDFNLKVLSLAADIGCPVSFEKPSAQTIHNLNQSYCDLIITAGYPYKMPVFDSDGVAHGIRGINIHPALLPNGRGRWPLPWLILKWPEYAGVTVHKLTPNWDQGDIIAQQPVRLNHEDDLETLSMKLQMVAPTLLANVLNKFDANWASATRQSDPGSYWPMPTANERRLDWSHSVAKLLRVVRAFSKFESSAIINGQGYNITRANGWVEQHDQPCGTLVHASNKELLVAVSDGYLVLQEYSLVKESVNETDS